jgi:hypothetical protein
LRSPRSASSLSALPPLHQPTTGSKDKETHETGKEKKKQTQHKDKRSKTEERFYLTNCFFCVVYQADQFQCIHPTSDFFGKTLRNIHPTSKFLQESLENLQN